jgi:maltose O-acetyltransferase
MGDKNRLKIGERSALANTLFNLASGSIMIGDRVIFSPNVMVLTGRHDFINGMRVSVNPEFDDGSWGGSHHEVPSTGFDITIHDGTWIGAGAIILGPVEIGSHSIVSAGSVVTKSFPSHSIVAGIPAKVIGSTLKRIPGTDIVNLGENKNPGTGE